MAWNKSYLSHPQVFQLRDTFERVGNSIDLKHYGIENILKFVRLILGKNELVGVQHPHGLMIIITNIYYEKPVLNGPYF